MQKHKIAVRIIAVIAVIILLTYARYSFVKNQIALDANLPNIHVVQPSQITSTSSTDIIDLSPEAIAKWDVCRNEKYGYEFKYPKGWRIYQANHGTQKFEFNIKTCTSSNVIVDHSPSSGNIPSPFFRIVVSTKDDWQFAPFVGIKSLDEYFLKSPSTEFPASRASKKLVISGEKALLFILEPEVGDGGNPELMKKIRAMTPDMRVESYGALIVFFHDGSIFNIDVNGITIELLETMLDNFKFIN